MGAVVGRFSGRRKQKPNADDGTPGANRPEQIPVRPVPPLAGGPGLNKQPSYHRGTSVHRQLSTRSIAQRGDTLQSKSLNREAFGDILKQTSLQLAPRAAAVAEGPVEGGPEVGSVRVRSIRGYNCGVSSVTPLGAGKGVAVASLTGEVHLWSLADPPPRPHLLAGKPFRLPVSALAFSARPNSLLATAGYDHQLSIWEVLEGEGMRWKGQEVGNSAAHQSVINCVAISQCGKLIATGGGDKAVIRVWDAPTNMATAPTQHPMTERGMLVGHWSWVTALAFSSDSKLLFSSSLDGTLRVWDVECLEPTVSMGFHDHNAVQSRSSCYLPSLRGVTVKQLEQSLVSDQAEQRFLFSHSALGEEVQLCKLYDADGWGRQTEARFQYVLCETGEVLYTSSGWLRTLRGHTGPANCVAMAPDGSALASAGDDGCILLWAPQFTRNEELILDDRFAEGTAGYHILSIEDEMLPVGGADKCAMTIPVEGGDVRLRLRFRQGHYYCKAGGGARPRNLKKSQRPEAGFLERMRNPVYQIVRDDGSGEVLFDWNSSRHSLAGHQGPINAIAFTQFSSHILSASDDGTVRVWDAVQLTCHAVLHSPTSSFAALALSPSPPLLLLGDKSGAFHVIDHSDFDGETFVTDGKAQQQSAAGAKA